MISFGGIVPALSNLWEDMLMILKLVVLGVLGGVALGTVSALMRLSYSKLLSNIAGLYVNYFRSIPLLLVIAWLYFMVPFILRWIIDGDTPAGALTSYLVTFMMSEAAYYCETARVGIQAIPKSQMGAAWTLGMTYRRAMRLVILPQALCKMTLLLLQQSIILLQDISPIYTIGLADFLNPARSCGDVIGQVSEFLIFAGLIYFVVSSTASSAAKRLQKRLIVWFPSRMSASGTATSKF